MGDFFVRKGVHQNYCRAPPCDILPYSRVEISNGDVVLCSWSGHIVSIHSSEILAEFDCIVHHSPEQPLIEPEKSRIRNDRKPIISAK
jgi:hypothetical protein